MFGWVGGAGDGALGLCGQKLSGMLTEETRISWKAGRATLLQEAAWSTPALRHRMFLQGH